MRSLVAPVIASVAVHTVLMLAARHAPESLGRRRLLMPMRVAQSKKPDEPKEPPPKPVMRVPRRPPKLAALPAAPPAKVAPPTPPPPPQGFSVDSHKTVESSSVAVAAREGGGNMFADPDDGAPPAPKTTAPAPPPPPPRFEPPQMLTDELSRLPPYPSAALRAEIDGQVLLRVCIGTTGAVDTVEVVKGLGFGCDEAASSWAKSHWRFRPARRLGTPVSYCIMQPVRFQLQR
ncbi:MAG: energy transducer TonB [Polyangia bacterium]